MATRNRRRAAIQGADAPRPACAWEPSLGAWCTAAGTHFRVWAPLSTHVDVLVERSTAASSSYPLTRATDGTFGAVVADVGPGDRYRYRLNGGGAYADPASRFQPAGVHGPSQVVDARRFTWSDTRWHDLRLEELVLYELHVGTFTPSGTFAGIVERLPYLRDLGVTAIELMPVADFPGQRNWGYDGVCLFAPARCYGTPDELRQLVNAAHGAGLGVVLDVVYNHFGPDGAYAGTFSPYYFSKRHQTPWGDAINLDGEHSDMVRSFFIENALHWIHEYHIDGLRLDATHALHDDSPRHFLAELCARVRAATTGRHVLLIAEDHRNLARIVRPSSADGWGLDAVWADDFHHQVRRALAGDHEGYYADFSGSMPDLAATIRRGWLYCGQHSVHFGRPRGSTPVGIPPRRFVVCIQNHDQVGNRAFGERLHEHIDYAAYRAACVLLLCVPETPLLFMGQEWAAGTPFLYFTDHHAELGKLVTAGRRQEFAAFSAFADPQVRARVPDPQDVATFQASRLDWSETGRQPNAATLRLHRALLALRRSQPALQAATWDGVEVAASGDDALVLQRGAGAATLLVVVRLRGAGIVDSAAVADRWEVVLTTEDLEFTDEPVAIQLDRSSPAVIFGRPGAVILRRAAPPAR